MAWELGWKNEQNEDKCKFSGIVLLCVYLKELYLRHTHNFGFLIVPNSNNYHK